MDTALKLLDSVLNVFDLESLSALKCLCGAYLIQIQSKNAYNHSTYVPIWCDRCYKKCDSNEIIYHCPIEHKSTHHPNGYDICVRCFTQIKQPTSNAALNSLNELGYGTTESVESLQKTKGDVFKAIQLLNTAKCTPQLNFVMQIDNQRTHQSNIVGIENSSVYTLFGMGYGLKESLSALSVANGDITAAVQYLKTGIHPNNKLPNIKQTSCPDPTSVPQIIKKVFATNKYKTKKDVISIPHPICCGGDIKKCSSLIHLKKILEYQMKGNNTDYFNIDIVKVLNNFFHLLYQHQNIKEFEFIYNFITPSSPCDIKHCKMFTRNRRNRINNQNNGDHDKQDYKYDANNYVFDAKQDILDQIHCHYLHSFDIGYRLTEKERDIIVDKTFDGENELQIKNKILSNKHKLHHSIDNTKYNKFNQINNPPNIIDQNINNLSSFPKSYSFGQEFIYWDRFKNVDQSSYIHPDLTPNKNVLFVAPKYSSFKEELTSNEIVCISIILWDLETEKGFKKLNSDYCKSIQSGCMIDISTYPVNKHEKININHLIAVSIYCSYTELSFQYSKTFRKLNDTETERSLKRRHSNFHFLSKYIHETVNVFSNETVFGRTKRFYHGISQNMMFTSMNCCMNQAFSTTSEYDVAMAFAVNGLVLELKPNEFSKYFDCSWLSNFSNERELLFIGGANIIFENITSSLFGDDYRMFIRCISIIETMVKGSWFNNNDETIIWKIKNKTIFDPKPISPVHQYVICKLIKHELNQHDPVKYKKWAKMPSYIEHIFHYIAVKKEYIQINWETLKVNIINEASSSFYGDCGYKFMKHLFVNNNTINLKILNGLYPQLKRVEIINLELISLKILNSILNFLSQNPKQIEVIILKLNKKHLNSSNRVQMQVTILNVKQQYEQVGYKIYQREQKGTTSTTNNTIYVVKNSIHTKK